MSEGVNKVTLLGNIGADPELKMTSGGQAVLKLRLATSESYLDNNKVRRERTAWHTVTVWGKRAESLGRLLSKGERLYIEGRIQYSQYDKADGSKGYSTDIVAGNVVLLGGRGGGASATESRGREPGDDDGDQPSW